MTFNHADWRFGHAPRPRSKLYVQLIFVTYRRHKFLAGQEDRLRDSFLETCACTGCRLVASNGSADHWHVLVQFNPAISIAQLVNQLKSASSRHLGGINRPSSSPLWSKGYYANTISGDIRTTSRYIKNQNIKAKLPAFRGSDRLLSGPDRTIAPASNDPSALGRA